METFWNEVLRQTLEDERKRVNRIESIKLNWEVPFRISVDELPLNSRNPDRSFDLWPIPFFKELHEKTKYPAVYYFKATGADNSTILQTIRQQKEKRKRERAWPKIPKQSKEASDILYVGSVRKGLCLRYVQHLGLHSEGTYALHLIHWARGLNLEIDFNYCFLERQYFDLAQKIESGIAKSLHPLVGKHDN